MVGLQKYICSNYRGQKSLGKPPRKIKHLFHIFFLNFGLSYKGGVSYLYHSSPFLHIANHTFVYSTWPYIFPNNVHSIFFWSTFSPISFYFYLLDFFLFYINHSKKNQQVSNHIDSVKRREINVFIELAILFVESLENGFNARKIFF